MSVGDHTVSVVTYCPRGKTAAASAPSSAAFILLRIRRDRRAAIISVSRVSELGDARVLVLFAN